jgi:hypothetical protein
MELHGGYREQGDGEHGHCQSRAGEAEVPHWGVAAKLI